MGKIIAGMALSHAFALLEPDRWDDLRELNRQGYQRRYGEEPPNHPKIAEETLEGNRQRYQRISSGIEFLRQSIATKKPDAVIVIGDDQNENFRDQDLPQLALYTGDKIGSIIRENREPLRVMLCASGGLSHFTGGYPWKTYRRPYSYGGINEEFDREILDWMTHGDGQKLARLTLASWLLASHGRKVTQGHTRIPNRSAVGMHLYSTADSALLLESLRSAARSHPHSSQSFWLALLGTCKQSLLSYRTPFFHQTIRTTQTKIGGLR
jgi:hypothetical protein